MPTSTHLSEASILASLPDPVVALDFASALLWANPAAEARFGWRGADLLRVPLATMVHPDDLSTAMASLSSVQTKAVGTLVEIRLRDSSGRHAWFEIRGRRLEGADAVVLILRECTDRHRWELGNGDPHLLSSIVDASSVVIALLSASAKVRSANRELTRLLGHAVEDAAGRPFAELAAEDDQAAVAAELALAASAPGRRSFETRLRTASGAVVPVAVTVVNLLDDLAVEGLVLSARDITKLVETRESLRHLASHDDLTGLPNRNSFRRALGELLDNGGYRGRTVLFGDVDGLKGVNDRHGHAAGDAVLAAVGHRLRSVMRPVDLVARISGDEFAMIIDTHDAGALESIRDRIDDVMERPVRLPNGVRVAVSITIGESELAASLDVDDILAAADAAMYVGKRSRLTPR